MSIPMAQANRARSSASLEESPAACLLSALRSKRLGPRGCVGQRGLYQQHPPLPQQSRAAAQVHVLSHSGALVLPSLRRWLCPARCTAALVPEGARGCSSPDGHLQGVERVLQRVVRVDLVDLAQKSVYSCLPWVSKNHELDAWSTAAAA